MVDVDVVEVVLCPGRPEWECSAFRTVIVDEIDVLVDAAAELTLQVPNAD